jgi:hypothetical protein
MDDFSMFGDFQLPSMSMNTLTYCKTNGSRCYKGKPYSGIVCSKSGRTTVELSNGKIVSIKNDNDSFVYTLRKFHVFQYGVEVTCIYINGIYLDDEEFARLFPELSVFFTLKEIEISPMWPATLMPRKTPKNLKVTIKNYLDGSVPNFKEPEYTIGVLEL